MEGKRGREGPEGLRQELGPGGSKGRGAEVTLRSTSKEYEQDLMRGRMSA